MDAVMQLMSARRQCLAFLPRHGRNDGRPPRLNGAALADGKGVPSPQNRCVGIDEK
jgi:hypothetical protein